MLDKSKKSLVKATPFVKWVGGKRGIFSDIIKYVPSQYNHYYEPFVGGGALFFGMNHKKTFLSDTNQELITTYSVIKKNTDELLEKLKEHKKNHCETYFYKIRANQFPKHSVEIAARFIYLNKTCYNGLYRVNKKGEFNSPIGRYKNPNICDCENILNCKSHLNESNVTIQCQSFEKITPCKGDFVYFDPPYHQTYSGYSSDIFDESYQRKLRDVCDKLNKDGVFFTLSNSNTEFIQNLYAEYHINEIAAPRFINCKSNNRKNGKEVIVTNHETGRHSS